MLPCFIVFKSGVSLLGVNVVWLINQPHQSRMLRVAFAAESSSDLMVLSQPMTFLTVAILILIIGNDVHCCRVCKECWPHRLWIKKRILPGFQILYKDTVKSAAQKALSI